MLYDQNGVAFVNKPVEDSEQHVDVLEMEAGGWFIENEERAARVAFCKFGGEFDTLVLASAEGA